MASTRLFPVRSFWPSLPASILFHVPLSDPSIFRPSVTSPNFRDLQYAATIDKTVHDPNHAAGCGPDLNEVAFSCWRICRKCRILERLAQYGSSKKSFMHCQLSNTFMGMKPVRMMTSTYVTTVPQTERTGTAGHTPNIFHWSTSGTTAVYPK